MANVSAFTGAMPVIPGGLVEVGRVTRATDFTVSDTASPGTTDIFANDLSFVADGGTYLVTFYAPYAQTATNSGAEIIVNLVKGDGTNIGRIAYIGKPDGGGGWNAAPIMCQYHYTPAAGAQSLNVRAWRTVANGTIGANTNYTPAFLSVSKIVNQNDGLKPFWTPPVVTQLPSNATVGDQVVYAADATNGVYWSLYYDGIGTYPWKFVGGSSLKSWTSTTFSTASTSFVTDTNFTGITIPLAGDYEITAHAMGTNTNVFSWFLWRPNGCGYDTSDYRCVRASVGNNGNYESGSHYDRYTLTTGTLGAAARAVAGTMSVGTRSIHVSPVRVAA